MPSVLIASGHELAPWHWNGGHCYCILFNNHRDSLAIPVFNRYSPFAILRSQIKGNQPYVPKNLIQQQTVSMPLINFTFHSIYIRTFLLFSPRQQFNLFKFCNCITFFVYVIFSLNYIKKYYCYFYMKIISIFYNGWFVEYRYCCFATFLFLMFFNGLWSLTNWSVCPLKKRSTQGLLSRFNEMCLAY